MKCVLGPLPKPPFREEANGLQIGRGRALGFHMGISVPPHEGRVCWSREKLEVASGAC